MSLHSGINLFSAEHQEYSKMTRTKKNGQTNGQVHQTTLPFRNEKVGRPRLDPYTRLMARFYESVFLLYVLGQTRGPVSVQPYEHNPQQMQRRQFLGNIAFLCDFAKGGRTCAAVALESTKNCYNLWIGSNVTSGSICSFLEKVLQTLNAAAKTSDKKAMAAEEAVLLDYTTRFACHRIHENAKILIRSIPKIKLGPLADDKNGKLL
jgi:hypothetical protein